VIVRIYGELYNVELSFFDNIEILEVKEYTNTVFIDYTKGENYKDNRIITLSMDKEDYLLLVRHLKIKSLGI
jgi:hypothetical protein